MNIKKIADLPIVENGQDAHMIVEQDGVAGRMPVPFTAGGIRIVWDGDTNGLPMGYSKIYRRDGGVIDSPNIVILEDYFYKISNECPTEEQIIGAKCVSGFPLSGPFSISHYVTREYIFKMSNGAVQFLNDFVIPNNNYTVVEEMDGVVFEMNFPEAGVYARAYTVATSLDGSSEKDNNEEMLSYFESSDCDKSAFIRRPVIRYSPNAGFESGYSINMGVRDAVATIMHSGVLPVLDNDAGIFACKFARWTEDGLVMEFTNSVTCTMAHDGSITYTTRPV